MPNFFSLAGLELAEKMGGVDGGGGFQVATMPNLNASCLALL